MPRANTKKPAVIVSVNKGKRFQDITGQKFGEWTALSFAGRTASQAGYWNCKCSCGTERLVATSALFTGATRSCGSCGAYGKFLNYKGFKFGRLTVVDCAGRNKSGNAVWECVCDCGNRTKVAGVHLKKGTTASCGCLQKERASIAAIKHMTTHGMCKTPEFAIWNTMKQRCYNPKSEKYRRYGGRGITVCDRWLESFENFFADMGPRPSPELTVGRRNNDGNYCPENCSWETVPEQVGNKCNNVILNILGEDISLPNAARKYGVKRRVVYERVRLHGWSHEKAVGLII